MMTIKPLPISLVPLLSEHEPNKHMRSIVTYKKQTEHKQESISIDWCDSLSEYLIVP